MSNMLIQDAKLILDDLTQRQKRLTGQVNSLQTYNGWVLRKGMTRKSGLSYYDVIRPGSGKKVYLGSDRHKDVVNVKRLRYAKESIAILQGNIKLLKMLIDHYVDTDYATVNERLPATYRTELSSPSADSFRANMPVEALRWIEKMEKEKAKYPPYKPEQLKHPALDGTMMRSKSEVIIANILLLAGSLEKPRVPNFRKLSGVLMFCLSICRPCVSVVFQTVRAGLLLQCFKRRAFQKTILLYAHRGLLSSVHADIRPSGSRRTARRTQEAAHPVP